MRQVDLLYIPSLEEGFDLWNAWSSLGSTYDRKNIKARWRTFRKGSGGRPVTIASLIYHAMNAGFKFDETKKKFHRISFSNVQNAKNSLNLKRKKNKKKKSFKAMQAQRIRHNKSGNAATPAANHPYLTKKDVMAHNTRVGKWVYRDDEGNLQTEENALLVPLYKKRCACIHARAFCPMVQRSCFIKARNKAYITTLVNSHTILICEGLGDWRNFAWSHTTLHTAAIDAGNLNSMLLNTSVKPTHCTELSSVPTMTNTRNQTRVLKPMRLLRCRCRCCLSHLADVSDKPTDFNDLYFEGRIQCRIWASCQTDTVLCSRIGNGCV